MSDSNQTLWTNDPWGQIGRGLSFLLALALPFLGRLEAVPLAGERVLPVVSLLSLIIPLFALASLATGGASPPRWRWALPVALAVGLLSGLGGSMHGEDPVLSIAAIWEPMLLVAGAAILFSGHPTERLGLLTALVFSTLVAAALGFLELMNVPGIGPLLQMFRSESETWQLIPRLTGPLAHGDAFSWLAAVLMPVLAAAAISVFGRRRELVLIVIGIFWVSVLLSLSYGAPIAALAGMLVVMASRAGFRRSLAGLSAPLLIGIAVAMLYPGFRARWGPYESPVGFTVRALTALDGADNNDSLHVTVVNPGPVTWPAGYETGYHLLYPERIGSDEPVRMLRGGWVSTPLARSVSPGDQLSVTLPFHTSEPNGFIVLDLKGPGGLVSQYRRSPYLLLYRSADEAGEHRLGRLMHVQSPRYIHAASEALRRGTPDQIPPLYEVWGDVYSLLGARPWFGLGPGASTDLLGYNARNLFLEVTVAAGWTGLAALIVFLLVLNVGLLSRGSLETYMYAGALFAAVLHGMSAFALDDLSARTAATLLVGLAWAAAFGARSEGMDRR